MDRIFIVQSRPQALETVKRSNLFTRSSPRAFEDIVCDSGEASNGLAAAQVALLSSPYHRFEPVVARKRGGLELLNPPQVARLIEQARVDTESKADNLRDLGKRSKNDNQYVMLNS